MVILLAFLPVQNVCFSETVSRTDENGFDVDKLYTVVSSVVLDR